MSKKKATLLIALAAFAMPVGLVGCVKEKPIPTNTGTVLLANGGFESGNLSGWTVEYGDAFDDWSVSSQSTFSFEDDAEHNQIDIQKTGNWFLSGRASDGKRDCAATGAIRSQNFVLGGNGKISLKLAGGAITRAKGDKTCYVGVYTAKDDKLIHKFTNSFFSKHETSYVDVAKYDSGTFATDNFLRYTKELPTYVGSEMYIRIVDNDVSNYYGYISVDDIRIGSDRSQPTGTEFVKMRGPQGEAKAPTQYDIINGGFETGDLTGWTIVQGDAFSNDGVNSQKYYWAESIPYNRDGNYHFGYYNPTGTGVMQSSEFVLGGSGVIGFKLGGCADRERTYLRVMVKSSTGEFKEAERFSNTEYWDKQFPYVANGLKICNLVQYYADLSEYMGNVMRIDVVDENDETDLRHDGRFAIVLDSVCTYYERSPLLNYSEQYYTQNPSADGIDEEIPSEYQVLNGTFETGDLTGWTHGNPQKPIGDITRSSTWWSERLPYNKKGKYLFSGLTANGEPNTGTLTSSPFTVGGDAFSFLMGGGANGKLCYISIISEDESTEYARFANHKFNDLGIGRDVFNKTSFLANMVQYKGSYGALGIPVGTRVKIRITDNATKDWGLITVDSFITYYEKSSDIPSGAVQVINILNQSMLGSDSEYQVLNGDFESGDLTGWTVAKQTGSTFKTEALGSQTTFWGEMLPFNKGGKYFLNGALAMANEADTFVLRSQNFVLGGSGFISFKLGGKTAALRVRDSSGTLIAEYRNTEFNSENPPFPYVDLGCRLFTMTTYVADLSVHLGKTLYIELVDLDGRDFGNPVFDDIITYYETSPVIGQAYDSVYLAASCSSVGAGEYRLMWKAAVPYTEQA